MISSQQIVEEFLSRKEINCVTGIAGKTESIK